MWVTKVAEDPSDTRVSAIYLSTYLKRLYRNRVEPQWGWRLQPLQASSLRVVTEAYHPKYPDQNMHQDWCAADSVYSTKATF